jgi:hypothetical protein
MSESQNDEILTGREGIEAAQGFTPMPAPGPSEAPPPDLDLPGAIAERTAPEFAVTDRRYVNLTDGEPRPDHEVIEIDRAVSDLGARRAEEFEVLEQLKAEQLRQRVEARLNGLLSALPVRHSLLGNRLHERGLSCNILLRS